MFGDPTRHKTLIFDLDETLIHAIQIKKDSNQNLPMKDFEFELKGGEKF